MFDKENFSCEGGSGLESPLETLTIKNDFDGFPSTYSDEIYDLYNDCTSDSVNVDPIEDKITGLNGKYSEDFVYELMENQDFSSMDKYRDSLSEVDKEKFDEYKRNHMTLLLDEGDVDMEEKFKKGQEHEYADSDVKSRNRVKYSKNVDNDLLDVLDNYKNAA